MQMVIELSKNYPDKKRFEAWLLKQGHEIDRGIRSTCVDGDDVDKYPEAAAVLSELEKQFKRETSNG